MELVELIKNYYTKRICELDKLIEGLNREGGFYQFCLGEKVAYVNLLKFIADYEEEYKGGDLDD